MSLLRSDPAPPRPRRTRRRLTRRLGLVVAALALGAIAPPALSAAPASAACTSVENQLAGGAWYPDQPSRDRGLLPLQFEVRCDQPVKVWLYSRWVYRTGRVTRVPNFFDSRYFVVFDNSTLRASMRYRVSGPQQYLDVTFTDTTGASGPWEGVLFHDPANPFVS